MSPMRLFKHLAPWLMPLAAQAQLFTNNGAVITTTANVHINGGMLNDAGGEIRNNGTVTLTGDWTNNAGNSGFGTSQGTVVLSGADQSIAGSSVSIFNNLMLSGTGTKTLQQHTEVGGAYLGASGAIALHDRSLDLNGFNLTVRNAAPTAITRTTGFIVSERDPLMGYSRVRWKIGGGTVGNTHVIPFGNAVTGHYLPFSATITTAGGGINGWISMATYPTDPTQTPNNRPLPAGLPSLIDVSGMENAPHVLDRWWVLESGGYLAAPVADISMTYRDSEWMTGTNTINEATLQLERMLDTWTMFPTVVDISSNGLSTSAVPLLSSIWTAAEYGSPLPVELLSFQAERRDASDVLLQWTTATERDNAGFEVWRMIEGEDEFVQVGWMDGHGNSQQLLHYTHIDHNPTDRVSYYHLRQVDHDGSAMDSPVNAVQGMAQAPSWVLAPNPARDRFNILGLGEGVYKVNLLDGAGRQVREWSMINGLSLDGVPAGLYLVHLQGADGTTGIHRLVVQ